MGSNPYLRLRAQVNSQSEYGSFAAAYFVQALTSSTLREVYVIVQSCEAAAKMAASRPIREQDAKTPPEPSGGVSVFHDARPPVAGVAGDGRPGSLTVRNV